ncbi:hypothetical protein [Mastigocoleus testarum]|uniref:Uncharacterized protein n=1 Tax=Mastigocoleus testarum BC008 TaxID=371196 RepID=A0A0V7ZD28_9CYAN|nr:hypothetical protein [Mastigocoleus testarum]KST62434.1 hypothetical protein BC008_09705 [Mastigocoleus testarum BC008]
MLNKSVKSLFLVAVTANLMIGYASARVSQNEIFMAGEKVNNRQQKKIETDLSLGNDNSIFAQNSGQITRIRTGIITQLIENLFKGTKIYLHNLGPKKGKSWHQKNSSYIQLSKTLGGRKQNFDIPESTVKARAYGTLRYYVDNIKLSRLNVKKENDAFKLSLFFESNGTELKGYHTARFVDFGDRGAPDIEMDNMRLDVYLKPAKDNFGRLSYDSIDVKFDANIQAGGVCNIRGTDICNRMFKYKKRIASAIESNLRAQLNNQRTRERLAASLYSQLKKFGIGRITGVNFQRNNLVIRHQS